MRHIQLSVLLLVCGFGTGSGDSETSYQQTIRAWQHNREATLRKPDSWLTLAGLFWLSPGQTRTIGSGPKADFALARTPYPLLGSLRLEGTTVTFIPASGAEVTVDDHRPTGPPTLRASEDTPAVVQSGSISFYVIERNGRLGVRVKDAASPVLQHFAGLGYFPISSDWHFQHARFVRDPKKIPILNVLGQTDLEDSPGIVEFTHAAKTYRLRPILEGDSLFFLFKDLTNHTQTYQAGRMLNTAMPHDGTVDLDFNRSYNPPCTFTPYATCPLPPRENNLPIAVTAGELRYRNGHPQ